MDDKIIAVYCLCDDLLIAMNHHEDPQCHMSDAQVMTTAIVAALYFRGNYETARQLLLEQGYIPTMLGKSRFNRRLHRIKSMFLTLFAVLSEVFKELNIDSIYVIDTLPIPVCDNWRIPRAKLYQGEAYRGYHASKRRYFYGLKIHLLVTKAGEPVEFFLTCGSFNDTKGLQYFDFDLPPGSEVFGDKSYNDYEIEDVLSDTGIHLKPIRKKNSHRLLEPWQCYLQSYHRKIVETTNSMIERLLPKSIHAVTAEGFELKVVLFCLACSLNYL